MPHGKLTVTEAGVLFINDAPELRPVHAMQPAVHAFSATEFFSVFRYGSAMESVDSMLCQMRTHDAAKTWSNGGFIRGTVPDATGPVYSYFCPHMTALRDGRLVVLTCAFRRDDPNQPLYNPKTGGCLPCDTTLFISNDKGKTWSGPIVVRPGEHYAYAGGPMVELANGRWMVVFETWKAYDDPSPMTTRLFALFSSDQGQTWGDETTVCEDQTGKTSFDDVQFLQLADATIVAMAWTHDRGESHALPHHRIVSPDNGRTWQPPEPTNRKGQYNVTRELPDGRLFGAYNLRHVDRPGVYATLSTDQGKTWDIDRQVQVWDATGRSRIGSQGNGSFLKDVSSFAFGKPDACVISDREILVVFWATEACVTHTRWAKVVID